MVILTRSHSEAFDKTIISKRFAPYSEYCFSQNPKDINSNGRRLSTPRSKFSDTIYHLLFTKNYTMQKHQMR